MSASSSTLETPEIPHVGTMTVLRGTAWAGGASLRYLEVSTDDGLTWEEAQLTGDNRPASWVEWEHPWVPRHPGAHAVITRATDNDGLRRPMERHAVHVAD